MDKAAKFGGERKRNQKRREYREAMAAKPAESVSEKKMDCPSNLRKRSDGVDSRI